VFFSETLVTTYRLHGVLTQKTTIYRAQSCKSVAVKIGLHRQSLVSRTVTPLEWIRELKPHDGNRCSPWEQWSFLSERPKNDKDKRFSDGQISFFPFMRHGSQQKNSWNGDGRWEQGRIVWSLSLFKYKGSKVEAKLVPTFADGGCQVVSETNPYGRILGFLDRSSYFFFQLTLQLYSRG
jgi:hypothetical protein